ncbi:unnamed protein product [Lepeophtheirus salmonis]|uniref:(salmon louse) hypothetical protein n=1 Tax=Lepeophtheirus salmonis TaxID=72036 RepID=A0A7R8D0E1_LEPSM|nr:unnamed protein product [Lepeophtheirus salmonis]CAF2958148.1 unnamed protein product [Lepeophtheirus salmonis]
MNALMRKVISVLEATYRRNEYILTNVGLHPKPKPAKIPFVKTGIWRVHSQVHKAFYWIEFLSKAKEHFSCEVSSLPSFDTRQGSAQVVVGRLPMSIPEIDSSNLASKKLKEGDVTSFNCSSFGSIPPPNITWFINGNRASENPLSSSKIFLNQSHHIPYGWDTKSQLTLPIESQLLTPNASRIKIKCLVTLYDLYYKSHEITLEILREMKERDSSHRRARPKKTVTRTEPILDVYAHSPGIGSGGVYSWGFMTSSLMTGIRTRRREQVNSVNMKKVLWFVKKKRLSSPSPVPRSPSLGSIVSCYEQNPDSSYFKSNALHAAVYDEDLEKVKKILGRTRYDVTLADNYGRTPLHLASSSGNVAILWQLLHARAGDVPLHRTDMKGATPLHRAVDGGHAEAAEMLLERGCPLDISDEMGNTVLHLAIRRDAKDLTSRLLRKGANPDILNSKGETPMLEAIRLGRIQLAQNLLRSGASPHTPREKDGMTPLMLTCRIPDLNFAEILLDYDANPEELNPDGKSAIHFAKETDCPNLVETLERAAYIRKNATYESEDNSFDDVLFDGDLLDEHEYSNTQIDNQGPSNVVKKLQVESKNVREAIENLSSWSSSTASPASAGAKARTVMDLSKMLPESPSDVNKPNVLSTKVIIGSPNSSHVPNEDFYDEENSQNIYDVPEDVKEEESSHWSSSVGSHGKNSKITSPKRNETIQNPSNEDFGSLNDRRKSFPTLNELKNDTKTSATFTILLESEDNQVVKQEALCHDATISEDNWDSDDEIEPPLSLDVSSLKSQVEREKEKKLAFKEELQRTRDDQEKLSDENEELRDEISKVQYDNKELKKELVEVTVGIRHKEESIQTLEQKIKQLTEDEVVKSKEITKLKKEIDQLLSQLETMESVKQHEISDKKSALNRYQDELEDKSNKISSLEQEIDRLKIENDKIEELSKIIHNKESVLDKTSYQHGNLIRDHSDLRGEYERLKMESSEKESRLQTLVDKYSAQIQALESRLYERETELQQIIDEKARLVQDKEISEVRLRKEIEMLQFQNESFDNECKKRQKDNEALFQEKNNLLLKHKYKDNEKDNLVQEISVLKVALEQEKSTIDSLRKNESERTKYLNDLLSRIKHKEVENAKILEENKCLSFETSKSKADIHSKHTSRVNDLENTVHRLETINYSLNEEIKKLKSLLHQRDDEIADLMTTMELNSNLLKDERAINNNHVKSKVSNSVQNSHRISQSLHENNELKGLLETKDTELADIKTLYNDQLQEIASLRNDVLEREKRIDNVILELDHSNEKLKSANVHIGSLKNDISRIENQYNSAINDKNDVLVELSNSELRYDDINRTSLVEYRSLISKEKAKVEEKQDKCIRLLNENGRLEKEIEKLQKELCDLQVDLDKAFHERRTLQHRMMQASNKALTLEDELKHEKRRRSVHIRKLSEMEHRVEEEKKMYEKFRALSQEKSDVWDISTSELKSRIRSLQIKNDELNKRILSDGKKIMSLNEVMKKSKDLRIQNEEKDQLIKDLQEKIVSNHQKESLKYQKELKKMRMKFEIMARNELNQKLSEDFLMENIQNDLSSRLLDARKELGEIKNQMKATERGIVVLQRQLQERELELSSERSLRRKLEKQVDRTTDHDRFIQPIGLPLYSQPAYF